MGEAENRDSLPQHVQPESPKTPKRKLDQMLQHDTPHVQRFSGHKSYVLGNLEQRRKAVMAGLPNSIPELPIQTFINHLLPKSRLDDGAFEMICKEVTRQSIYDTTESKWPSLGETGNELKDFGDFHKIQSSIVNVAETILDRGSGIAFASDGNKIPESDWTSFDKARPDGGARLERSKRRESDWHWGNMFRADEFKPGDSEKDKYDNLRRCIWALHFILAHDISRRFAFGLCIAKRTARLFFSCRSFMAVSEEFNICESWMTLIRITLAFAFATDEQLGWDLTITRDSIKSEGSYTITIDNKPFRVVGIINNFRAFSLLGRATRAFLAKDVKGVKVVIKDVWVDGTRKREHQIQQEIFADLEAANLHDSKLFFFEHVSFGDVCTSDGIVDSTAAISKSVDNVDLDFSKYREHIVEAPPVDFIPSNSVGEIRSHSTSGQIASDLSFRRPPNTVMHRVHYRLVMKEFAKPLRDVLKGSDCLSILSDLNDLIFILAKISWIHRDLSVANVYCFEDDSGEAILKLGDLEYAKKLGTDMEATSHDVRTGTQWFWSVEVEFGMYLWQPAHFQDPSVNMGRRASVTEDVVSQVKTRRMLAKENAKRGLPKVMQNRLARQAGPAHKLAGAKLVPKGPIAFRHNPLHELESLWWITLYCFAMRKVADPDPNWVESKQRKMLEVAFPSHPESAGRLHVFITGGRSEEGRLKELMLTLDKRIEPLHHHLSIMSSTLQRAYSLAESTIPEVNSAAWTIEKDEGASLYNAFDNALEELGRLSWPDLDFLENKKVVTEVKKRKSESKGRGGGSNRARGSRSNR